MKKLALVVIALFMCATGLIVARKAGIDKARENAGKPGAWS